jgi:hypothetical protein
MIEYYIFTLFKKNMIKNPNDLIGFIIFLFVLFLLIRRRYILDNIKLGYNV